MLWNNGVLVIDEDGNTTINSEKAQQTVAQIKQWIDEGLMMWGYGSNGSTNMRQAFWDGQVFAIVHTSSQYMNHYDNMKQKGYELGAYFPPAGSDPVSYTHLDVYKRQPGRSGNQRGHRGGDGGR